MRYQLTLQFRGDSIADYDAMIALEDELTEQLGDSADVDGHDCGSGETNIFIFTRDPVATFQRVSTVLERTSQLQTVTAVPARRVGVDTHQAANRLVIDIGEGRQQNFRAGLQPEDPHAE